MKNVRFLILVCVCGLLLSTGCAPRRPYRPSTPQPEINYITHTVKYPGETLAVIAGWYTGSGRNWSQILEHNPGLDVRRIRVGNEIQIPDFLVVKNTPMPKTYLDTVLKGKSADDTMTASVGQTPPTDSGTVAMQQGSTQEEQKVVVQPEEDTQVANEQETKPEVSNTETVHQEPEVVAKTEESNVAPSHTTTTTTAAINEKPAEKADIKLKTRDELLKELLED